MAFEEKVYVDRVEISEGGYVHVRTATVVLKDGAEIAKSYHRHVINPGDDFSGEVAHVQSVCKIYHTQENISLHAAKLEQLGAQK